MDIQHLVSIYGIKLLKIDNLDENRKLVFLK